MPIPIPSGPDPEIFPLLSQAQIDAARLSAWYPTFEDLTIESIVIDLEQVGEKDQFISVSLTSLLRSSFASEPKLGCTDAWCIHEM
jgi:hypothetical protein